MILIARPRLINQGPLRVFRDGSWISIGRNCRSALRDWNEPTFRSSLLGFRVALRKRDK